MQLRTQWTLRGAICLIGIGLIVYVLSRTRKVLKLPAMTNVDSVTPERIPANMMNSSNVIVDTTQLHSSLSSRSYVVPMSIWEQTLSSSVNLMQLQCWVKTLGPHFSLVEPQFLLHNSRLGFSFDNESYTNLTFSTIFDLDSWYELSDRGIYIGELAPFISKEDFIEEISKFEKNIVLVAFRYPRDKKCANPWKTVTQQLKAYHNLTVTMKVCVKIGNKEVSPANFKSMIFGDRAHDSLQNTVLIMHSWGGIQRGRNFIKLRQCSNQNLHVYLQPSRQVLEDAEMYAKRYLGGFEQYVSVAARFEKLFLSYGRILTKKLRSKVGVVIKKSINVIHEFERKYSLNSTWLSFDYGRWGSDTFRTNKYFGASDLLIKFQKDVYKGKISLSEYERSFLILMYQHPAYVAIVQMTLSSKGRCLIRIGTSGKVSGYVLSLFKRSHKAPHCIKVIA